MIEIHSAVHDTEDKNWWVIHGRNLEYSFVHVCTERLGIQASVNPQKEESPYVPDLIVNGRIADLKTQNSPFFKAGKYGCDPQYTITFNRKDYERYKRLYPNIDIFIWLDWQKTDGFGVRVDYLSGIYRATFEEVARLIEQGAPEHFYLRRQDPDDRNAKSSFLLDVRRMEKVFETRENFLDHRQQRRF